MKLLKDTLGFTLTEILIGVGIVGTLAAISITQYQKYTSNSRRGEAKANLASLYSSEKVYFTQFQRYTSQLDAIGFNPVGEVNYAYGFSSNGLPAKTGTFGAQCWATNLASPATNCIPPGRWTNSSLVTGVAAFPNSFVNGVSWKAFASSNLNQTGRNNDIWVIDSQDNLINLQNGI